MRGPVPASSLGGSDPAKHGDWFRHLAVQTANYSGRPITFGSAVLIVALWGISGPIFGYSDTWQLVINTSTTIVTFLMVFLIQATQNRDTAAIQLKLDELIRSAGKASNRLIAVEELTDEELEQLKEQIHIRSERASVEGTSTTDSLPKS